MGVIEGFVADILEWLISWVPWTGLAMAVGFLVLGVLAMDEEGDIGRDFFLFSIAVSLITGLFVALVRV